MSSHSSIPHQWPDQNLPDSSKSYALSGRIMLASIIILFVVVIFLVTLHLYARWYLLRLRNHRNRRTRSTRIVFYVDNNPTPVPSTVGLNPSVIKSLPVFVFSPETDGKSPEYTPECAVCLSEFEPGETGRVLPKCKHSFHTECIDMWFFNNSTCPLCRSPVEPVETTSLVNSTVLEPGSSGSVGSLGTTSFGDRLKRINDVRIDIPNRNEFVGGGSELQLTSPSQGFRSPGSRLLSRIINMSWKSPAVSPSSGGGGTVVAAELDVESVSHELSQPGSGRRNYGNAIVASNCRHVAGAD